MSEEANSNSDFPIYRFRSSLMGTENVFRLAPDALEWDIGRRSGRVRYSEVKRIRLGFRPANLAASRFITEIWTSGSGKLTLASTSARSLFESENLAAAYRDFVERLIGHVAAAGQNCVLDAGFSRWRWWPAALFGAAVVVAVIYVAAHAFLAAQFSAGAVIAFLGLIFIWQMGSMILRNRPRKFAPHTVPADVLP